MSESQSPPPDQPQPSSAGDPSMEDILASIRRILSEDETNPATSAAMSHDHAPHDHPLDDVLDLDAAMIVEEPIAIPPSAARPPAVTRDPEPAPVAAAAPPPTPATPVAAALVAPETAAAAASSVGALLRSVVAGREQVAVHRGGPTLEDMVREEIRPLLKLWLDTNLPPLVERLVRAEMERVVGRVS